MTSWRKELAAEFKRNGDSVDNIEYSTLSTDEMDAWFKKNSFLPEGKPFVMWTKDFVYFSEWVGGDVDGSLFAASIPRHPKEKFTPDFYGYG